MHIFWEAAFPLWIFKNIWTVIQHQSYYSHNQGSTKAESRNVITKEKKKKKSCCLLSEVETEQQESITVCAASNINLMLEIIVSTIHLNRKRDASFNWQSVQKTSSINRIKF